MSCNIKTKTKIKIYLYLYLQYASPINSRTSNEFNFAIN